MRSSSLAVLAIGLAVMVAGCQRAPEAPRASQAPAVDHLEEARKALAVADWATAAPHLRAALQKDPDSLFLHYNLAICATWLDQRDEAIREFEWVLAHAASGSEEATTARRWLAQRKSSTADEASSQPDPTVGDGEVHGVVLWGEPPTPQARAQLLLHHVSDRNRRYVLRTDQNGNYEFKRVPAGSYKLADSIGDKPRWRLKVTLEPGQELALDLTPDNGVPRRDDFPGGK